MFHGQNLADNDAVGSQNTLESKMESMIINPSKTIRKVQQTYTGGCWSGLSRDFLKNLIFAKTTHSVDHEICNFRQTSWNPKMDFMIINRSEIISEWNCPNDAISVIQRSGGPNVTRTATEKPPNVKGMKAAQEAAQQQLTNDPQGGL
ncbi:hypothetical protein T12_11616 [Trichinella patagoniensis]|uniref:Uncharacterized protein n=1 Tax=Trichinella patagoniensis TaxID=990121 RepID=A0A0V0ZBH2_9BILA|nr:hypothetical protein T12_11616 [Trichinella patagoniensis]